MNPCKFRKKRRPLLGIGFLCLFVCFSSLMGGYFSYASPGSQEGEGDLREDIGDDVQMEVIWNGDGAAQVGDMIPFTVRIASAGPVSGTVSANVYLENEEYYAIKEPVSLQAGQTRQVDFRIPITYASISMLLTFTGDDGTLYGMESITLNPVYNDTDLYVGAVTEERDRFDWCRDLVFEEHSDMDVRLSFLTADEIPEMVSCFEYYDVLFLDAVRQEQWTDAQEAAVRQWVWNGGILIVGNDSDFFREAEEGEICRESYGTGLYVYCGFSLGSLNGSLTDQTAGEQFFQRCIGERRWDQLADQIAYGSSDYLRAYSLTPSADADRIPNVLCYVLVFAAYLVILGPVLYFGLKRKKMQGMLRLSMAGISILFTFIIYLMGSRTRYISPFASYVSICQLSGDQVQETTYLNIQSPYHTLYTAEVADGYELTYLPDNLMGAVQADWTQCTPRLEMTRTDQGTTLEIYDNVPFTPEYFRLTRSWEETGGKGLTGEMTISAEGAGGTLTNHTGMDLVRVSVWTADRWIYVGDLPDGATVRLEDKETGSARIIYRSDLIEKIAGSDSYSSAVESEEAAAAFWRDRILQYDIGYVLSGTESAEVYAFPAEEDREIVRDDAITVRGITMICTDIAVDYDDGDLIYVPNAGRQATVLSGHFDALYGSTYEQVSEIRYSFGEYELETLYAEWPDEERTSDYMKVFEGTMEFYNIATQSYDVMEQKDRYERSELTPYLAADHSIRVRWSDDSFEEYTTEVLLPIFSYTGRPIS